MTMKLVCDIMINGVATLKVLTTNNALDQGALVKTKPGVGKPFLMFASLPGVPIAGEMDLAPVVSEDVAVNNATISQMIANPETYLALLTFPPAE